MAGWGSAQDLVSELAIPVISDNELSARYAEWAIANGIDPTSGCRVSDVLCQWGEDWAQFRLALSIGIGLVPGIGDGYQVGTIAWGNDPIAGIDFTNDERSEFGAIWMSTGGLGVSSAFPRQIGRPLREGVDEFFGPTVVLGRTGKYERMADDMGAAYFKLSDDDWLALTPKERRALNRAFLDEAVAANAAIFLASPVQGLKRDTMLYWELKYLVRKGYSITVDQTMLVPPRNWP
jgi:hypothetical protein